MTFIRNLITKLNSTANGPVFVRKSFVVEFTYPAPTRRFYLLLGLIVLCGIMISLWRESTATETASITVSCEPLTSKQIAEYNNRHDDEAAIAKFERLSSAVVEAKNETPPPSAVPEPPPLETESSEMVVGVPIAEAERYVARFVAVAQKEMDKFGIPASIKLAQGLLESKAGQSTLATGNKNHFGMKCFSRNCRPGHCSNHRDDSHKDFFRIYKSAWESWRAHSHMLTKCDKVTTGCYAWIIKKYPVGSNKYEVHWAYGLQKSGYATDPNYPQKILNIIDQLNLKQYDQ